MAVVGDAGACAASVRAGSVIGGSGQTHESETGSGCATSRSASESGTYKRAQSGGPAIGMRTAQTGCVDGCGWTPSPTIRARATHWPKLTSKWRET
jgi:hypothetical protein